MRHRFGLSTDEIPTDKAFIRTIPGITVYIPCFSLAMVGFLMVLNISPPLIGKPGEPGLHLKPDVGPVITKIPIGLAISIFLLSVGILLVLGVIDYFRRSNERRFQILGLTILTAIIYYVAFLAGLLYLPYIENSRATFNFPGSFYMFLAVHLLFIAGMTRSFLYNFLPMEFENNDQRRIYFEYEWRVARLMVAIAITFIAGLSIPLIQQTRDWIPAWGLFYVWASFLPPLLAIGLLSFLRAKEMERQIRTENPSKTSSELGHITIHGRDKES